jgi:hypothetical protein
MAAVQERHVDGVDVALECLHPVAVALEVAHGPAAVFQHVRLQVR